MIDKTTDLYDTAYEVGDLLDKIMEGFKPEAKITLLVRTPNEPDRDFLLTNDDLNEVLGAVQRRLHEGNKK